MITLDSAHVYRDDAGVQIPGVTDTLKEAGLIDSAWFTEYSRDRGNAVHSATALYDQDNLDPDSVDEAVKPYLDGWIRFRKESGFLPADIEQCVFNETYRYAGMLDRTGHMKDKAVLCDIKSGQAQPATPIQLAAYAGCLNGLFTRYAVELHADGTYKMIEYKDRNDWQVWLACLAVRNWKVNHGGNK